jgi:hypothetical protein
MMLSATRITDFHRRELACKERHFPRHAQLDLSAHTYAAQYTEAPAHRCRSLAHVGEAPVARAPMPQRLGVNSTAVVANQDPQPARRILQINLDLAGTRMAESVRQGLTTNHKNFVKSL